MRALARAKSAGLELPTSASRIQNGITKVFFTYDAREPISMRQRIALAPTVIDLQENRVDQAATSVEGMLGMLETCSRGQREIEVAWEGWCEQEPCVIEYLAAFAWAVGSR